MEGSRRRTKLLKPSRQNSVDHSADILFVRFRCGRLKAVELLTKAGNHSSEVIQCRGSLFPCLLVGGHTELAFLQHRGEESVDDLIMEAHCFHICIYRGSLDKRHTALQYGNSIHQFLVSNSLFRGYRGFRKASKELLLSLVVLFQCCCHNSNFLSTR